MPTPGGCLAVADLSTASVDEKLAATTLQGLVNSGACAQQFNSSIFLQLAGWDQWWLRTLNASLPPPCAGPPLPNATALLAAFGACADTAVLVDPAVEATFNVATMLASAMLRNGTARPLVLTPVTWAAARAYLPPTLRVVDTAALGFSSNASAYRWALAALFPALVLQRPSRRPVLAYVPAFAPIPHHLRDYLLLQGVFVFFASADPEELAVAEEIMGRAPPNTPLIGFFGSSPVSGLDEYTGVGLAGQLGILPVVCDWATNLSLLGGLPVDLPATIRRYRARLPPPSAAVRSSSPVSGSGSPTVYLSMQVVESGDSPSYWLTRQYQVWNDTARGRVPIGWGMGYSLLELMPAVAAYFFEQASPQDYVYLSISGTAYTHPYRGLFNRTQDPEQAWQAYLQLTTQALARLQCSQLGLYTNAFDVPFVRSRMDAVTARVAAGTNASAIMLGMGRDTGIGLRTGNYRLGPAYVGHIQTRWDTAYSSKTPAEEEAWLVAEIRAQVAAACAPPNPPCRRRSVNQAGGPEGALLMPAMALSWAYTPTNIANVLAALGDAYQPVSLPELQARFGGGEPG